MGSSSLACPSGQVSSGSFRQARCGRRLSSRMSERSRTASRPRSWASTCGYVSYATTTSARSSRSGPGFACRSRTSASGSSPATARTRSTRSESASSASSATIAPWSASNRPSSGSASFKRARKRSQSVRRASRATVPQGRAAAAKKGRATSPSDRQASSAPPISVAVPACADRTPSSFVRVAVGEEVVENGSPGRKRVRLVPDAADSDAAGHRGSIAPQEGQTTVRSRPRASDARGSDR